MDTSTMIKNHGAIDRGSIEQMKYHKLYSPQKKMQRKRSSRYTNEEMIYLYNVYK